MCGIVGYCGTRNAPPLLMEGLKRLEYRGYDSAGVSVATGGGLKVVKRSGKLSALAGSLPPDLGGNSGIGHTRWATHGEVSEINAHPHMDTDGGLAIVHNGIIENHKSLKRQLLGKGVHFRSETDSEVIVHLLAQYYDGNLESSVRTILPNLKGTYGIIFISASEPGKLVGVRNGSPLVLGIGDGEMFLASDVTALIGQTKQIIHLEDGEMAIITPNNYSTTDSAAGEVYKEVLNIPWAVEEAEKEGYPTFMEKEICEQPETISRAILGRIFNDDSTALLSGLNRTDDELRNVRQIIFLSAGSSHYAGLVAARMIESVARIPCRTELAAEVRYSNPIVEQDSLYIVISQSGETADSIFAAKEVLGKGGTVLGICNVVGSTIPRLSSGGIYIHAGPEISVASTKAFTATLSVLVLLTLRLGRGRYLSSIEGSNIITALSALPSKVQTILDGRARIAELAEKYSRYNNFLFLGRGIDYPIALEGALKLKEIAYLHAEGIYSAELKHGPLALITDQMPVVFLIPNNSLRGKNLSTLQELKARHARVLAIATEGDMEVEEFADDTIFIPETLELLNPIVEVIPLQLLAYYTAVKLDLPVDQPRNLAKSVTVE